jgi:ketosteroid isomerase-like protein
MAHVYARRHGGAELELGDRGGAMDQQAAVDRVRESLDLVAQGDLERLRDFYTDDVVWHVGGNHPLSGDYRGKDDLIRYFERVRELTGGSLTIEPQSILASDKHVAMFTNVRAQREGRSMDVVLAQVFKVAPDGRWSEYWALADDQEAVDRFWS